MRQALGSEQPEAVSMIGVSERPRMQRGQMIWTAILCLVWAVWGLAVLRHVLRGDLLGSAYGIAVFVGLSAAAADAVRRLRAGESFRLRRPGRATPLGEGQQ